MTDDFSAASVPVAHDRQTGTAESCQVRVDDLEVLVKVLSSGPTPYGSESFQRVRDQLNPRLRALLMEVLGG